jgi:signal transduction histidine kinase
VLAVGAVAAAVAARYRLARGVDVVARTCHELRGPLTAVRLGLALAARTGELVDARARAIELELGRAALALDDLTYVWQKPPDGFRACERVDLGQLAAESVEAWRAPAAVIGKTVVLWDSGVQPVVCGERLRLAQAIGNLLANAVEHGGKLIEVSCRVEAAKAVVEVRDDGPGLTAPVSVLIRRRTRWARSPSRRRASGVRGHGLAIASAVAAAHGGQLSSGPAARGARLVLELPCGR